MLFFEANDGDNETASILIKAIVSIVIESKLGVRKA